MTTSTTKRKRSSITCLEDEGSIIQQADSLIRCSQSKCNGSSARNATLVASSGFYLKPSPLECLPTEVLQTIFISSLNGSLVKASPRIACKLSNSYTIQRCAFLCAFFSRHILDLAQFFKFDYLLLPGHGPIGSAERRSMMKAILSSRWCTINWLRSLHLDLTRFATWIFDVDFQGLDPESQQFGDGIKQVDGPSKFWPEIGSQWYGFEDCMGQRIVLTVDGPFSFSISHASNGEDQDFQSTQEAVLYYLPAKEEGLLWDLHLELFSERNIDEDIQWQNYSPETPLRKCFVDLFGLSEDSHISVDFLRSPWKRLSNNLELQIILKYTDHIRPMLERDFFFYAENSPFTIDRGLYLRAAWQSGHWRTMLHLFALDPSSLPISDTYILSWAIRAKEILDHTRKDIMRSKTHWRESHDLLVHEECPWTRVMHVNEILRPELEAKALSDMLQYMRDRRHRQSVHVDSFSPCFDNTLEPDIKLLQEDSNHCSCGFDLRPDSSTTIPPSIDLWFDAEQVLDQVYQSRRSKQNNNSLHLHHHHHLSTASGQQHRNLDPGGQNDYEIFKRDTGRDILRCTKIRAESQDQLLQLNSEWYNKTS